LNFYDNLGFVVFHSDFPVANQMKMYLYELCFSTFKCYFFRCCAKPIALWRPEVAKILSDSLGILCNIPTSFDKILNIRGGLFISGEFIIQRLSRTSFPNFRKYYIYLPKLETGGFNDEMS